MAVVAQHVQLLFGQGLEQKQCSQFLRQALFTHNDASLYDSAR